MHFLTRFLFFLLSSLTFYYVLNYVEPPGSWPQASTYQILVFFLPLLAVLTFLINIFLGQVLRSFVAALGIMFILVLMADKSLTPLSAAITFFISGMVFTFTPKIKTLHHKHLKRLGARKEESAEHRPEKHNKPPRLIKRL